MFATNVPEKIIKEVTGHKSSKALAIYERPTVQQKQAVSNILVTSSKSYLDEMKKIESTDRVAKKAPSFTPPTLPNFMTSMFSGLNNCNITISPQNFHVHMQPQVQAADHEFDECDSLVASLPQY